MKISLVVLVGSMLSVCHGQTLESYREIYSNDLSRIELKKPEVMKVALVEYVAGLDKAREGFVNNVNVRGIKAVDEIKTEIFNGNVKLDSNVPELLLLAKRYKDRETIADSSVLMSKRNLLEKYRAALKGLCAAYLKSDMAKAEKVSTEMEMVDVEFKSLSTLIPAVYSKDNKPSVDPKTDKKVVLSSLVKEPIWQDITGTFEGGNRSDGVVVLQGKEMKSKSNYRPPIKIEYVCKTDSYNLRISYACKEMIFNCMHDLTQFRIDGGPAGGQHREGVGKLPANQFVTIRQVVLHDKMEIYVDDELRASWDADFSKINSPIIIRSIVFSPPPTITVKSVRISTSK